MCLEALLEDVVRGIRDIVEELSLLLQKEYSRRLKIRELLENVEMIKLVTGDILRLNSEISAEYNVKMKIEDNIDTVDASTVEAELSNKNLEDIKKHIREFSENMHNNSEGISLFNDIYADFRSIHSNVHKSTELIKSNIGKWKEKGNELKTNLQEVNIAIEDLKLKMKQSIARWERLGGRWVEMKDDLLTLGVHPEPVWFSHTWLGRLGDDLAALDERDAWEMKRRACAYRTVGQYREALTDFSRAITLYEMNAQTMKGREFIYWIMNIYWRISQFVRVLFSEEREEPQNPRWVNLKQERVRYSQVVAERGYLYRMMRRYEEALVDLDRAIALYKRNIWAMMQRGYVYRVTGQYEAALAEFNQIIELGRRNSWVMDERGRVYRALGKYKRALADFNRAIALHKGSGWHLYGRSQVHYLMRNWSACQLDIEAAIELEKQALSSSNVLGYWRGNFNLIVFDLFLDDEKMQFSSYEDLIAACPLLQILQEFFDNLEELLTVQPGNTRAQSLQQMIQERIQELVHGPHGPVQVRQRARNIQES